MTVVERLPLEGIRVLELGTLIAGPFATRLLGDFGAEVVKVEAPAGDPMRDWGAARYRDRPLWWPLQSRSKKLVTLDLRTERGQELCRELSRHADVLVENFRPGTMERWGLAPEDVAEVNPRLVYARVSGFGQTGPYAHRAGFAAVGEAMSGLRHLNGFPDRPPPRTGLSLGDSLTALFTVIGILVALRERDGASGRGQTVDASILESCFAMLESVAPEYDKVGVVRGRQGTGLASNAPSNIYESSDGTWMAIAANNDSLWRRLCGAMGQEQLAHDERYATHDARSGNAAELDALIGDWAAGRTATEILDALDAAGVVCGPVNTIAEVFADPHVQAREMLATIDDDELDDVRGPAVTPRLSRTPGRTRFTSSWVLGRDNDEVFGGLLGLDGPARAELADEGVI